MKSEPYLLNIHTTGETAVVNLAKGSVVMDTRYNYDFKEHGRFLHTAIEELLQAERINPGELEAICVTSGPGSYTGIRVGLAAAKGLAFALHIPLITLNTLEIMTLSAISALQDEQALYCPMIDARRREVYTALYDYQLTPKMEASAVILDNSFLKEYITTSVIYCFGSGSLKFQENFEGLSAAILFKDVNIDTQSLALAGFEKYQNNIFSDLTFSNPLYLKEFVSLSKKHK